MRISFRSSRGPQPLPRAAGATFALAVLVGCSATLSVNPFAANPPGPPPAPDESNDGTDAAAPVRSPFAEATAERPGFSAGGPRANLVRHTYSESGGDFDPDVSPDGKCIFFASTRQASRPDIFVKPLEGYALTQITNDPASDVQPRVSPDGRHVVFASDRSGNWDIWVVELETNKITQLTDDAADEIAPCWSPDGKLVAFSRWGSRSQQWELWELSPERPGPTRFLTVGAFPDWAPDGKRLAFQRPRERGARWYSVWVVDRTDAGVGYPTEIASSEIAACVGPRFSPDGGFVAFAAVRESYELRSDRPRASFASEIWLADAATGRRRPLTGGSAPAHNPAWSPDGRLFFVSALSGKENIWSTPLPITSGGDRMTDGKVADPQADPPIEAEPVPGDS